MSFLVGTFRFQGQSSCLHCHEHLLDVVLVEMGRLRLSSRNAWLLEQSVDFSDLLVELSQQVFVRLDLDLLVMMVFMNGNVMLDGS